MAGHQGAGGRYTGVSIIDKGIGHMMNFLSDQPPPCKMPGCNKPCYVENNGRVHDFCGKTHAMEYKAIVEAENQRKMMRDKRLRAIQDAQSTGGHGGSCGWQGQQSYGIAAAQYGSYTRSGASYGAYNMVNQPTITNQYGNMVRGSILFYNRDEPYYEFTNFYPAPIDLDGTIWPTTEHYFQAQKFIGTSYPEVIRNFDRPRQAFDLSRNPTVSRWRREDWEDIKIDIMRKALLAKFTQHKHLRQKLLGTGNKALIEHTPHDKFWGDGGDGSGKNHLGLLLMEIRNDLKNLQASLRQQETPRVTPDSHHECIQRSESTEKDGQSGLSSSSSSSMDYISAGADKSSQNQQNDQNHQESANQDDKNNNLTRHPLHSTATENTGSPPHQQLAATVGEGSPQGTPVPTTNTNTSEPPMGNLIIFDDVKSSEEDKDNPMMTDDVPPNLDEPLQPMPPAPGQCMTHAGQCTTQPPDSSTLVGEDDNDQPEQMDTDETNDIH